MDAVYHISTYLRRHIATNTPWSDGISVTYTRRSESTLLGFPANTLRDSIDRPEALDTGGIIMTGLHPADVVAAMRVAIQEGRENGPSSRTPADYLPVNTSVRAVNFIMSTARRHKFWSGLCT